jgi:hypothetical protein
MCAKKKLKLGVYEEMVPSTRASVCWIMCESEVAAGRCVKQQVPEDAACEEVIVACQQCAIVAKGWSPVARHATLHDRRRDNRYP